jgi:transposase
VNQYIGKSRGGNTTKIHAVVDGLGNPVCFKLSGGHVHDSKVAIDLLSNLEIKSANILADKAYGTKDIRNYITSQEADYTIPPKSNTKDPWDCDWRLYKERHLVECFFNKIKHFRRVASTRGRFFCAFKNSENLATLRKSFSILNI